jgi:hypothetical protein
MMGMDSCSGPPLLVMFWPPPRTSGGGSTLGDVFVAWMPPGEMPAGPLSSNGYGTEGERLYIRYGPNISQARAGEEELGYHESRHVDQWAVANFLAGPLAFPVAYFLDAALFPTSRNHQGRVPARARQLAGTPVARHSGHSRTLPVDLPTTTISDRGAPNDILDRDRRSAPWLRRGPAQQ